MKSGKWENYEDVFIMENVESKIARNIASALDRSITSVNNRIYYLRQSKMDNFYTDVYRICPQCHEKVEHKNKILKDCAEKKNYICRKCSYATYSEKFRGEKGPFYGKKITEKNRQNLIKINTGKKLSEKNANILKQSSKEYWLKNGRRSCYSFWLEKYGKEEADKRMIEYGRKISERNSGEGNAMYGKPTPKGAGNGWQGWYKNFYFRSIRELQYYIRTTEIENKSCVDIHLLKNFRIGYLDKDDNSRTYSPDFLVESKYIVEVKPVKLQHTIENELKFKAAKKFCEEKGYTFQIIDIEPDSASIKEKYLNGEIKFNKSSLSKYLKYIESN